jgi:putative CocE/NonD family hydrolase
LRNPISTSTTALTAALAALACTVAAQAAQPGQSAGALPSDIPAHFEPVTASFDYDKREVMIPMRDGAKLHTIIITPKGASRAPILLQRTPYNAEEETSRNASTHETSVVNSAYAPFVHAGYIIVVQDVRGKYGSQGVYVNERPLRGPDNPTAVDHSTDAYDTIDWLVKNTPQSNGRVGMIGNSYDGMMVLMALVNPHPALKAAAPANPVGNTWMGDDDFHGGAFRLIGYDYYHEQDTAQGKGDELWRDAYDDYDTFLRAGSAWDFVKSRGLQQLGFVQRMADHPTYDAYWKAQAMETALAGQAQTVPTLFIAGQYDQEDMYGAVAAFEAVKPHDTQGLDHLVLGPWYHGQWAKDGSNIGDVQFGENTARWFRTQVLLPFFDEHLKDAAPKTDLPPVLAYQTGTNTWQRLQSWPQSCTQACPQTPQRLYLQSGFGLGFTAPKAGGPAADAYVSDPTKPVPYRLRPIRPTYSEGSTWSNWLADDQRIFSDRPDVLTYETPPLTAPVSIAGAPIANIIASTTGSDSDWVVKLIDVYPDETPDRAEMGGYQFAVAMDIFRGRYRDGYETAKPIAPNKPLTYRFPLPNVDHVFLPGHRIMVQIQSSWFPLYDRNPQTFVPNIFHAKAGDYRSATQRIFHAPGEASFIDMPIVSEATK